MLRHSQFRRHALAGVLACLLGTPGLAQDEAKPATPAEPNYSAKLTALEEYHALDQRLQDVGWQLVRGNSDYCPKTVQSIGLQLQDMVAFKEPTSPRATLGLFGDFAVQTVARGSPAWNVGDLSFRREITRLNSEEINRWPAEDRSHWQRLTRAHDYIDKALANDGRVIITLVGGAQLIVRSEKVCATRFELAGGSKRALAEGSRVVIGSKFVGFGYAEDEFAAAIAHELAHNLLGHRAWLDANGRTRKNVRLTEREADRLMPWLLANAGYEPSAAHRFMLRWGPKHDGGLFRGRTHDGWDERAEFIQTEVELIEALQNTPTFAGANWRTGFRREIDPGSAPKK